MPVFRKIGVSASPTWWIPPAPSGPATTSAAAPDKTTAEKLSELQSLLDQGLITQADHDSQKQKILDEMN